MPDTLLQVPTRSDGVPISRLYLSLDEATEAEVASVDGGRVWVDGVTGEPWQVHYTSPGVAGQAWRAINVDPAYWRLEASLASNAGPWTDLTAGTLADPSPAGTARVLYWRAVSLRWAPSDANPDDSFEVWLSAPGPAGVDEA